MEHNTNPAHLLDGLNPEQREAVLHEQGPLLILAGAGSGKTRVITHRIACLIQERGVGPMQVLAVTFTNKAAGEMRERVERLLKRDCRGLWISTFHASCARILRSHISLLGYASNYVIYDTQDQKALIRSCVKELNINEKLFSGDAILSRISQAKNRLLGPSEYAADAKKFGVEAKTAQVFDLYQRRLKENNALDFDDLLMLTVRLFQNHPEVLSIYQERFRHILVDEYQDTNHAQYRLIRLLSEKRRNLCVVGDDDQGIYSWRGADIGNILSFRKDYPDLKVIRLEENYRSTQTILTAAWHVVQQNLQREPKKLWTRAGQGEQIEYHEAPDDVEEAEAVSLKIRNFQAAGRSLSEIAVFYRTNAQSRVLEDAMRRHSLPYAVIGGFRFYDRKEVRDLLSYLRVIANPNDSVNLRRILNVPPRGIGAATLSRLSSYASERRMPLFSAMDEMAARNLIVGRAGREAGEFIRMIKNLIREKERSAPSEILQQIDKAIHYTGRLQESRDPVEISRVENIRELYSAIREFEEISDEKTLEAFLERVALVSDTDQIDPSLGTVTLMTLHSAKGLEFPVVFMTGMEEGLFPHNNSLKSESGLEEERRLCYVGLTRAKEKVFLSSAESRRIYGSYRACIPSRFIDEIPREFISRPARTRRQTPSASPEFSRIVPSVRIENGFPVGVRVHHPLWGIGTITESGASDKGAKVTVYFQRVGTKKLIAELAGLKRI
ncbi:MAG: ATP-dependent DNA helicase PcrA [Nitrospirae bacterium CG08_land_8_20_14_0_20_52_24]|nr:MAG: ATP-dependent DNA helicase PcrA [Nitrospirae bacterium CG08_land_8_20_14_0_20_52_24]PIV84565.1 MAG: ATP-dependent DNA helicase PcrA [Nitrospirae bacterium CG17_big_fil_post_rev_8_21_14_2_50_50_9]PIW85453.1 MAG: ATP-dependent DNA helicase PcrA [Nitrospirae bacterium CG_4_8_14_3_um_filter_50_41]PIX85602.1 MAG: ATP-dependent DNA helicase PcrA [Nitrospirae bacterium CG_4_10_14_3_um_filter_53_41]